MNLQNTVWVIAIVSAGIAFFAWFFKRFIPALRKWSRRADGIFGCPADPATGAAAVPSMLDRLSAQDEKLELIVSAVNKAVQQVQNSHVTNLRDDVDEVIGKVDSLHDKLDDHLKASTQPQTQINIGTPEPPTT